MVKPHHLIAHRGLYDGPDLFRENHPDQIRQALAHGFDAEIDVWHNSGKWFLGHDGPQYEVSERFFFQRGLWCHCKHAEALFAIQWVAEQPHHFWHQTDDFTITSRGFVWTYPGKPLSSHSICVQPEWDENWRETQPWGNGVGVCSKFVKEIRDGLASD